MRAHVGERCRDPVDGPPHQGLVAGELEPPRLPREEAGEEPHRRPRVGAVDRRPGLAEPAQTDSLDPDRVDVVLVHGHPEPAQRRHRRLRIAGAPEAADERLPVADPADHQGSMRDRLVPGHGDVPDERRGRLDLHRSESTGETTTP